MIKRATAKFAVCACALALAPAALAGCMGSVPDPQAEALEANRAYMAQVNESMSQLDEGLQQFVDAVSRDDVVNMRTQADNAYKALDQLAAIEAPASMLEIQEHYVAGADKLREALDGYIDLYTEVKASADASSMSKAAFDRRVAAVQQLYDEGVAELQEGDALASPVEEPAEAN